MLIKFFKVLTKKKKKKKKLSKVILGIIILYKRLNL